MTEETLSSRHIYSGQVLLDVRVDEVRLPDGSVGRRELVGVARAALVIPVLDDGRLVLITQYRKGVERELLEFPAGKLDPGEEPIETARRELAEESGYRAAELIELGPIHTSPGFCDEEIVVFAARGLSEVGQHTDADESITVRVLAREELDGLIAAGKLTDAKTLAGLALLEHRVFPLD